MPVKAWEPEGYGRKERPHRANEKTLHTQCLSNIVLAKNCKMELASAKDLCHALDVGLSYSQV